MKARKNKDAEKSVILDAVRLRECFGDEVVARAQRGMHNVSGLGRMEDGGVLATVLGGGEQVTYVEVGKTGEIVSECTCVAGCDCVHAATLALVWGDCVRREHPIPPIDPSDARLRRLDDEEPPKGSPLYENVEAQKALAYVESLDARERYYLLLEHMEKNPRFLKEVTLRALVSDCTDKELISATKKEVRAVCATTGTIQDVDFTMVEYCLKHVLKRKQYDALVGVAELLVKEATKLINRYYMQDAGIYAQVRSCLALCMEGVEASGLSEGERLEWDYRIRRMGKRTFFNEIPSKWDKPLLVSTEAWAYVAKLWAPIFRGKESAPYPIMESDYQKAVMYSKTEEERINERIESVDKVGDYDEVAKMLLDGGREEAAEAVCRKGIMRAMEGRYRVKNVERLFRLLEEMYVKRGDDRMALAIAVESFFQICTYDSYKVVREMAEKAMMVGLMEEQLKSSLKLGRWSKKLIKLLPDTGFPKTTLSTEEIQRYELLFTIVDREKNEEALKGVWSKMKSLGLCIGHLSEPVRKRVEENFPEDMLDYWFECLQNDALRGSTDAIYRQVDQILRLAFETGEDGGYEKLEEFAQSKRVKLRVRRMIEAAIAKFYEGTGRTR